MNLSLIQSTMKGWVAQLAGIALPMVVMQNEPRPYVTTPPGVLAVLSWVNIGGTGSDDVRQTVNAAAPTAILATGGASEVTPQIFTGAALNGSIGVGAISPPGLLELVVNASASWLETTATIKGLDVNGAAIQDTFLIPASGNANIGGNLLFASVTEVDIPAQAGTGGAFTVGTAESTTAGTLTLRRMTLQIGIETFSQDPTQSGVFLIEGMRGWIYGPTSIALLQVANLGLIDMDATVQADYRDDDDRWISRAVATVRLNQSDSTIDTTGTTQTIESVGVSSDSFFEPDGTTPAAPPVQWTDHVIGPP